MWSRAVLRHGKYLIKLCYLYFLGFNLLPSTETSNITHASDKWTVYGWTALPHTLVCLIPSSKRISDLTQWWMHAAPATLEAEAGEQLSDRILRQAWIEQDPDAEWGRASGSVVQCFSMLETLNSIPNTVFLPRPQNSTPVFYQMIMAL